MNLDTIVCADIFGLCATVPDGAVDAILCDLPYGVTACAWDTVIPFEPMWKAFKRIIKPRGAIVLTASQPFTSALVMSNPGMFRYEWIWDKKTATGAASSGFAPMKAHELILVFSVKTACFYPQMEDYTASEIRRMSRRPVFATNGAYLGGRSHTRAARHLREQKHPRSVIRINGLNSSASERQSAQHPTQKPVALFEYLIRTYTQPGELVFDPCCGSGTTAIAARRCERHFVCGDSSPEYVAIANERLRNTDPFQDRDVAPGLTQRSLFS